MRLRSAVLLVVVAVLCALGLAPDAHGQAGQARELQLVLYQPPLVTWVEDPFRPPAHIGASGNRGLQYSTSDGHAVRAAAAGEVAFAGQVGERKVITVQHGDGIRTTYTGLWDIQVVRGDQVHPGQKMGIAIAKFHFGARIGNHYLDPQILLDASEPETRARLLPPGDGFGG